MSQEVMNMLVDQCKEIMTLRNQNRELLEALLQLADECTSPSDGDAAKRPSREAVRLARAAISKAGGAA